MIRGSIYVSRAQVVGNLMVCRAVTVSCCVLMKDWSYFQQIVGMACRDAHLLCMELARAIYNDRTLEMRKPQQLHQLGQLIGFMRGGKDEVLGDHDPAYDP